MKRKLNYFIYKLRHNENNEYNDLLNIFDDKDKLISFKLLKNNKLLIYNMSVQEENFNRYINFIIIKTCQLLRSVSKRILDSYKLPDEVNNIIFSYCMINFDDFSKIIMELNNFRKLK